MIDHTKLLTDEELTRQGTYILPPSMFPGLTPPKFPAEYVVHIASGPVYCCERHANVVILFANAMHFKPHVAPVKKPTYHNCRECVYKERRLKMEGAR